MAARGTGAIVNVSTFGASVAGRGGGIYGASKAGLELLTRIWADEFGPSGVRVNAVAPSLTVTTMTEPFRAMPGVLDAFANRIPMGRAATADEVGDVIVFLASADARFVNGVNLPVDGGLSAGSGQPNFAPAAG